MTSKIKHKERSRKTNGPILFKSKDRAFHKEDLLLNYNFPKLEKSK